MPITATSLLLHPEVTLEQNSQVKTTKAFFRIFIK